VLALWALPCGEWARGAARRARVPYSVWTLGSDIWSLGRIPLVRARLRTILRDASRCFSDGLKLADDTRRISGRDIDFLPSTRRIVRRRADPMRAAPPYRLLFLGRWHANKGVDLLLGSLARLSEDAWRRISAVEILGGGPLEERVRADVAALRSRGRPIELGGFVAKDAAEAAMLRADYLLIPSRIESIPVVFSDAMKLEAPVIAMPVGDLPTLIGGPSPAGVVAREVSAPAFAEAIEAATRRAASDFAAGVASRRAEFDLDAVARRVAGLVGT
jgi:glycosyltransferase involved in cell wall biosynthesis